MKTEKFTLASASAEQTFHNKVRVIRYDSGNGSSTPTIRVRSLSSGELDAEMLPGRSIKLPELVDGIRITNLSGVPITGKITIGSGDIVDNAIAGSVSINDLQGPYTNGRDTVTSGAVVTLLPADAARRYVEVQNTDTGIYLRLTADGVDPTTSQGLRIAPGQSWHSPPNYAPTAAIKVIAESGSVAVEYVEG